MTQKRKICVDLTGRSSEEKDRIIKKIEQAVEEEDSQQEVPLEEESTDG